MRRISQLFSAAAVGVCSILTTPASGAPVEPPGLEGLMRADFAVAVAGGRISDVHLSDDQKKIIRLLRDMRKTPRGREMTDKAAQMGVIYAIHNYINGGAYYNTGTNIMGIELVDDGAADGITTALRDDAEFARMERTLIGHMFHEHTHFYQDKVWHTLTPPPGISSYDGFLWRMAYEAQAILTADIAVAEYEEAVKKITRRDGEASLADRFAVTVFMDQFHVRYYGTVGLRCDDGAKIPRDEFVRAFGTLPGQEKNFMAGVLGDADAIRAMFEKNLLIRAAAEKNGCRVPAPPSPSPLVN